MDVFGLAVSAGGDFFAAAAVAAAHELGVLAALPAADAAGGGRTVDELADALGIAGGRRRLGKLCDVLVAMGVCAREGERFVVVAAPPARPVIREGWGRLADVVRDDRPLAEDASPAGLARYHQHLLAAGAAAAIETAAMLGDAASLVDLGGGAGAYTAAFLAARPAARATIVDGAPVLELARAHLAGRGLLDRVTLAAGDARTVDREVGEGFDAALLANLLHLHGPAACAAMVRAAARAVVPGGLVAIKDLRVDDDRRGSREGLWFALNMAIYTAAGDVHPTATLTGWLAAAGLVAIETRVPACAPDSIVALGRRPRAGEAVAG